MTPPRGDREHLGQARTHAAKVLASEGGASGNQVGGRAVEDDPTAVVAGAGAAAIVPNISELVPEPETPVNRVSGRLGISTPISLGCSRARQARGSDRGCRQREAPFRSSVLNQPEDVAVGIGERGHQTPATNLVRSLFHTGAGGGHLGELPLDVRHVPVGHR